MALGGTPGPALVAREAAALCVAGVALIALGGALGPALVARDAAALCVSHFLPAFCVAGVALMALGGALGLALVARDVAALCVAGVALGDIYVRFTWQAWHNLTSTFVLLGRRGAHGIGWHAWARFGRA